MHSVHCRRSMIFVPRMPTGRSNLAPPCGRAVGSQVPEGRPRTGCVELAFSSIRAAKLAESGAGRRSPGSRSGPLLRPLLSPSVDCPPEKRRRGGACAGSRRDQAIAARSGHDREPPLQRPTDVMGPIAVRQVSFRMFPQRAHPSRRPRCGLSDRRPGALRRPFDLVPAMASATFLPCELRSHSPRNKKVSPGPLPRCSSPFGVPVDRLRSFRPYRDPMSHGGDLF